MMNIKPLKNTFLNFTIAAVVLVGIVFAPRITIVILIAAFFVYRAIDRDHWYTKGYLMAAYRSNVTTIRNDRGNLQIFWNNFKTSFDETFIGYGHLVDQLNKTTHQHK